MAARGQDAEWAQRLAEGLRDPCWCALALGGVRLRSYQAEVARAVVRSVFEGRGLSLAVMFPRQSGKNEVQAQIEAYLLMVLSDRPSELVKVSPTLRPQALTAMRRLERALEANARLRGRWRREPGGVYRVGQARMTFLSGAPTSHIVGATASTLLEVDEAQGVSIEKYDREIAPMAASTQATRVFWGTAWTSQTLLARELRAARALEAQDQQRRAFVVDGEAVAREVPRYGAFLQEQIRRLGRDHPVVRTQYYCEELDAENGMFPAQRIGLMRGGHAALETPRAGELYAFLLDVGGEEEQPDPLQGAGAAGGRRDSTALSVVRVNLESCADPGVRAPRYELVRRQVWTGAAHTELFAALAALAGLWQPRWWVVDATGVGAGLASFLEKAFPGRVVRFVFTAASKSRLGWQFLALVDTGRWREPALLTPQQAAWQELFFRQLSLVQYQALDGPGRLLRWGVPDGSRDPHSGQTAHDDLVLSAALAAVLDEHPWTPASETLIVPGVDPLKEMDDGF